MEESKFFVPKVGSSKKVLSLSKTKTQSPLKDLLVVNNQNTAVNTNNHNDYEQQVVDCSKIELISDAH